VNYVSSEPGTSPIRNKNFIAWPADLANFLIKRHRNEANNHGDPCSIPGQSVWGSRLAKWNWSRVFSELFGFCH